MQFADGPYKLPLDFTLPDYKAVRATLLNLTRSYHFDDASPPELDDDFGFTSPLKWDMLALPKLGEPGPIPFYTLRISSHISVSSPRRRQSFPPTQAKKLNGHRQNVLQQDSRKPSRTPTLYYP